MKKHKAIQSLLFLIFSGGFSHGAVLAISNVNTLTDDRLYADQAGNLMNGGIVAIGYFSAGILSTDVDSIEKLVTNIGNFTVVSTSIPGSPIAALGDLSILGYADNTGENIGAIGGLAPASIGQLFTGDLLIGREYYSIVTNAADLDSATIASEYALVLLGNLPNEDGGEVSLTSNPNNIVPLIGTVGEFIGDLGFEENTYSTLKMAVVPIPEPSTLLLSAIGVLALLRRKR